MSTRHPRRVAAAVAALLFGWGMAAFGVSPMTPIDPGTVVTHRVDEVVTPAGLQAQLEAVDDVALRLFRTDQTRGGDTADSLLARLGADDPQAAAFLRQDAVARQALQGHPGKLVQATVERSGHRARLVSLTVLGPSSRTAGATDAVPDVDRQYTHLEIHRSGDHFTATSAQRPLAVQTRAATGRIESSLFAAADEAQIPDAVTMQLAEIFGSDVDFRRELRRGDRFSVLYEVLSANGQPITWGASSGRVLAARFVNQGTPVEAYWFEMTPGRGGYFGADGRSRSRAFLASPLAFSRVTSGFAMRFHPIMKTWRAHLGVDYAAPTGTAVRAIGDGVIDFAGQQNGYGNVVEVRHDSDHLTLYAHLSRIDVKAGQRIAQGQSIGAVGATGWATGPHLHFEFRVDGHQVDPLKVARSSQATVLTAEARPRFEALQRTAAAQLATVDLPASGEGSAMAAQMPTVAFARME